MENKTFNFTESEVKLISKVIFDKITENRSKNISDSSDESNPLFDLWHKITDLKNPKTKKAEYKENIQFHMENIQHDLESIKAFIKEL